MKLVPLVELVDPNAGVIEDLDKVRPMLTEADRIAAAERPGEVTMREMAQIVANECPGWRDCSLCRMDALTDKHYFANQREEWHHNLNYFDVEWDPEIRL